MEQEGEGAPKQGFAFRDTLWSKLIWSCSCPWFLGGEKRSVKRSIFLNSLFSRCALFLGGKGRELLLLWSNKPWEHWQLFSETVLRTARFFHKENWTCTPVQFWWLSVQSNPEPRDYRPILSQVIKHPKWLLKVMLRTHWSLSHS